MRDGYFYQFNDNRHTQRHRHRAIDAAMHRLVSFAFAVSAISFLVARLQTGCGVEAKDNKIAIVDNSRYVSLGSAFGFAPGGSLNVSLQVLVRTMLSLLLSYSDHKQLTNFLAIDTESVSFDVQQRPMERLESDQRPILHSSFRLAIRILRWAY